MESSGQRRDHHLHHDYKYSSSDQNHFRHKRPHADSPARGSPSPKRRRHLSPSRSGHSGESFDRSGSHDRRKISTSRSPARRNRWVKVQNNEKSSLTRLGDFRIILATIFLKKPKFLVTFGPILHNGTFQFKTFVDSFWATIGKFGLLLISSSDHTGEKATPRVNRLKYFLL